MRFLREATVAILYRTPFVSLRRIVDPARGVDGYDYLHEDRCGGRVVAILPFRRGDAGLELLLRREVTPCWGPEPAFSSITGGVDPGESPVASAARELGEEAGFFVSAEGLLPLGTCRGTKSCDTVYHLFSVDLTGREAAPAEGDGSRLEAEASCVWSQDVSVAEDPLVGMLFLRLAARHRDAIYPTGGTQ